MKDGFFIVINLLLNDELFIFSTISSLYKPLTYLVEKNGYNI